MKKYRAILVGNGTMGKRHRSRFEAVGVEFSSVVESESELSNAFKDGENFNVANSSVDFAVIASPATTHYKYAKFFLTRKIPVFVEKPLATTAAEARELADLAESQGVTLFVAQSECFNPIFLNFRTHFARELTTATVQQNLNVSLEFRREHKFSERCRDVNVALDLLIHDVGLFLTLFRYENVRVASGEISKDGDQASLVLNAAEENANVQACFYVNRSSNTDVRELSAKIAGALGTATVPVFEYSVSLARYSQNGDVEHVPDSLDNEHKFFLKLLAGACGDWGRRLSTTAADAVGIVSKCL
ncbi:Gfo/Idh/MocA family protein [Fibrobacter sp.]|uniref:Gfo/Idh/MocA family protein n=1 Tax=Fibrobacter sp. TaxID=35828 RepID=UPI003890C250